jgi:ceramide glucosyltransferase
VEDGISFPPVTVLKPLYGLEPQLERNLESFLLQDYPKFELIFGARDASDPALNVQLVARFDKTRKQLITISRESR